MIQPRKMRGCNVSNLYWLSEEQMTEMIRIQFFKPVAELTCIKNLLNDQIE